MAAATPLIYLMKYDFFLNYFFISKKAVSSSNTELVIVEHCRIHDL